MKKDAMQNTGQQLVSFLEANGVDRVFCVPGESFLPVIDALAGSKTIDTVTARHESSAGFMALADGRLSGRPGVFMVSRGPGATNASIAVHSAQQDGLPLILFIGQVPRKNLGRNSFQEIDYGKMFGDIAKWVVELVEPERLPEIMSRAFTVAMSGTPGPVVISLPEDVLEMQAPEVVARASAHADSGVSPASLATVEKMLAGASRPLILAGGEFSSDESREALRQFAEKHDIPVVLGFRRHGVFPFGHRLYAGDIGVTTGPKQVEAFEQSDLILALGTRLAEWTTLDYTFPKSPFPNQALVHVCAEVSEIGKNFQPTVGIACRGPEFVRAALSFKATPLDDAREKWIYGMHSDAVRSGEWKKSSAADGVVFANVVNEISAQLPEANFVPDAGVSAALVYRYVPFGGKRKLYSTISGVMGYGVPGAVAIALRQPEGAVICLVGDGGFMMTGNELAVAVERKLPVRIFLSNNRSLGTIRMHQERVFPGRSHATDLSGPDFRALAESFGCKGMVINDEADVERVVREALVADGPVLVEVKASLSVILPKP
ncbi:MAG: putative pyruvate decarboxylase [Polaromonas sp.]|jgi:acetolactate synthase-1/2/3 large subunit|nr:putative pyruvate decarboxylase [Polaromonas sp.]